MIYLDDLQYYPTPKSLVKKMWELADIEWWQIESILEPSAGCGDLILNLLRVLSDDGLRLIYSHHLVKDIDCIELENQRRQILKWEFSDERRKELDDKEASLRRSAKVKVVGDDFLSYQSFKRYGLIIMNPPFADGDLHLLKALEMQKNGGKVLCLLNAETIMNPYTNTRKLLKQLLEKYNAKIEYEEAPFMSSDTERKAGVNVAIVYVDIPRPEPPESEIYNRMKKAVEYEYTHRQKNELVVADVLGSLIQEYEAEVRSSVELISIYESLKPHTILKLSVEDREYNGPNVNRLLEIVRQKYWNKLFAQESIKGKFTSKLRERYNGMVEQLKDYEFNLFNIEQILADISGRVMGSIEDAIFDLFDKLTAEHSWYPETQKNIHYFNGWKTNQAHMIGKKSIIPTWGMFAEKWDGKKELNSSKAVQTIMDIEKVFNYLSGNASAESNLSSIIEEAKLTGNYKNIECKYFFVDLYKKGTMHIKYKDMELVQKFNIYAAQNKNWLPPNYGKTTYEDMSDEEKAVVDSFQGKEAYEKVMQNKQFYLNTTPRNILMIGG